MHSPSIDQVPQPQSQHDTTVVLKNDRLGITYKFKHDHSIDDQPTSTTPQNYSRTATSQSTDAEKIQQEAYLRNRKSPNVIWHHTAPDHRWQSFFLNNPAPPEIYPLPQPNPLPI